jgi:hypothetical protein
MEEEERALVESKTKNYLTEVQIRTQNLHIQNQAKKQLKRGVSDDSILQKKRAKPTMSDIFVCYCVIALYETVTGKRKASRVSTPLMESIIDSINEPVKVDEPKVEAIKPAKVVVQETQPTKKNRKNKK